LQLLYVNIKGVFIVDIKESRHTFPKGEFLKISFPHVVFLPFILSFLLLLGTLKSDAIGLEYGSELGSHFMHGTEVYQNRGESKVLKYAGREYISWKGKSVSLYGGPEDRLYKPWLKMFQLNFRFGTRQNRIPDESE